MPDDPSSGDLTVPVSGRRLALPEGPLFHLRRADQSDYELGEFRAWAGYKNLGSDTATQGLAHFQHVLSFGPTSAGGRTGIHAHLAHAHIVIPTSGSGTFSYDGVVTEAAPGSVIVQHGGTVHDQFNYTYAAASEAETRRTPLALEAPAPWAPERSFGFLELFVPMAFANVEIVPPDQVSPADEASAWDHPYHLPGASFHLQAEDAPEAAYHPLEGRDDLEVRDAGTWGPTAGLVATWIVRPATGTVVGLPAPAEIAGEAGGVEIVFLVAGSARFRRDDGEDVPMEAGDTCTCSHGRMGHPYEYSPDLRLLRFFIAERTQDLRERTPEEIRRLEALGPRIIRRREVRAPGDRRPVNVLPTGG